MKFHLFLTAALGSVALAACGTSEENTAATPAADQTGQTDPVVTGAVDDPTASLADPATPQGFVDAMAASDMYEVEAGAIAQQKGANDAVKRFGEMMVSEHSTSSENLRAAVAQVPGLALSPRMTALQNEMLAQLQNVGGSTFDSTYKSQQIEAHEQTLALLQNYARSGTSAPLKSFAEATIPVVEMHLRMANELP